MARIKSAVIEKQQGVLFRIAEICAIVNNIEDCVKFFSNNEKLNLLCAILRLIIHHMFLTYFSVLSQRFDSCKNLFI